MINLFFGDGLELVRDFAAAFGDTDRVILLLGETGAGKEFIARWIHQVSRRSGEPFVRVNCANLTETLVESELFGHRKGAFTSAVDDRVGLVEAAGEGTLLLDEIGEMPLAMQVKMLDLMSAERAYRRVGETVVRRAACRIILATNRDVAAQVASGRLRLDLYQRIKTYAVTVPPLRERAGDIPAMAAWFIEEERRPSRASIRLSPESLDRMVLYAWPGNVRELQQAIERWSHEFAGEEITPEKMGAAFRGRTEPLKLAEVLRLVEEAGGNVTKAAERIGVHRTTLHRILKRGRRRP